MLYTLDKKKLVRAVEEGRRAELLTRAVQEVIDIAGGAYEAEVQLCLVPFSQRTVSAAQLVEILAPSQAVSASMLPVRETHKDGHVRQSSISLQSQEESCYVRVAVLTSDRDFADLIESRLKDYEDC